MHLKTLLLCQDVKAFLVLPDEALHEALDLEAVLFSHGLLMPCRLIKTFPQKRGITGGMG